MITFGVGVGCAQSIHRQDYVGELVRMSARCPPAHPRAYTAPRMLKHHCVRWRVGSTRSTKRKGSSWHAGASKPLIKRSVIVGRCA
jgi:hypothetical protein